MHLQHMFLENLFSNTGYFYDHTISLMFHKMCCRVVLTTTSSNLGWR